MKHVLSLLVGGYLLLVVGKKAAEAAGAMRCGCAEDCWCERPGLTLLRWVFPLGHRNADTAQAKAAIGSSDA